jgi:formylglycine-generating enzyme required for sulfatase activity
MRSSAAALVALLAATWAVPAFAVNFDWATVGDPGNPCEYFDGEHCTGGVDREYRISKFEVTNAQYAEFLNAVAASDPNGLYIPDMGSGLGGIARAGSPGSYTYSPIAGRENKPVVYTPFYSVLRFVNWLNNGQPTGPQDESTTEDGAYTITANGIAANSISRNAGFTIFLTSEDEWVKAAYYDAVSASYFLWPMGSDVTPTCALPGPTPNTANCRTVVGDFTDVGGYTGSPSPYGTFDQGGNASEWIDTISGSSRVVRGGTIGAGPGGFVQMSSDHFGVELDPLATPSLPWRPGFRVTMIPEPSTALLLGGGLLVLGVRRQCCRA